MAATILLNDLDPKVTLEQKTAVYDSGSGARRLARAFGSPVAALGSIGCRAQ